MDFACKHPRHNPTCNWQRTTSENAHSAAFLSVELLCTIDSICVNGRMNRSRSMNSCMFGYVLLVHLLLRSLFRREDRVNARVVQHHVPESCECLVQCSYLIGM